LLPKASIKGVQQHHALEENECLVVGEGFPVDKITVLVEIQRQQPQSCEGLCDLQEKLVAKGEH
jgi:hypothetical protein